MTMTAKPWRRRATGRRLARAVPASTLVSLKYLSGLRYEEIAVQTQLTVSNVGYKLHHTLKSLASSLRQLGIETAEG